MVIILCTNNRFFFYNFYQPDLISSKILLNFTIVIKREKKRSYVVKSEPFQGFIPFYTSI